MSAYEEQYITVSDDNGNETLYEVLFTFDSEDYGKSYILLIPAGSEPGDQVDVLAYSFDSEAEGEDVDLNEIESDEEWDMVEGVLDTFLNDENMQYKFERGSMLALAFFTGIEFRIRTVVVIKLKVV